MKRNVMNVFFVAIAITMSSQAFSADESAAAKNETGDVSEKVTGLEKRIKELEMTKEMILPLIRKQPEREQPRLELPLPSSLIEIQHERKKDESTERGVWTIDI